MVASEKHQDGTDHLHAFIKYEKKTEWAPRKWDLDGFHGNYQKARSWQDVKAYCMKGGNFISSFDVDAATRKKSCGRALNKRLLEEDLTDLVQEGVVRLQDYLRIKAAKEAFIRDQTASLPRCVGFIPNTFNLCFPMITGKQRHLWIWSSGANKGKTTFLLDLRQRYPCHMYAYGETFQTMHTGTQFVLLTNTQKPISKLLNSIKCVMELGLTQSNNPVQLLLMSQL